MDEILQMMQERIAGGEGTDKVMLRHLLAASVGVGDVTKNATLTNFAVAYENAEYIADLVMPVVEVGKKSGDYFVHDSANMFNMIDDSIGSNRGSANEVDWKLGTSQYTARDRSLISVLPFDIETLAEPPLSMQATEVDNLMNHMSLAREYRVSQAVFGLGNYGANVATLAGSARWDDYTNSDPAAQIDGYLESPIVRPNVAVIGEKVWRALKQHPKMKELILSRAGSAAGSSPLRITKELFAAAFELDRVYVPRARYNTARAPGAASLSRVWDERKVAFIRVEEQPNLRRTSTFGYTFRYSNSAAGRPPVIVSSWFDQRPGVSGVTYFKVSMTDAEQIVAGGNAGYLLDTVVS